MYSLVHRLELRCGLAIEVPCLLASMLVAELFYKFRSFTVECLAFLATWFVFSGITYAVLRLFGGDREGP